MLTIDELALLEVTPPGMEPVVKALKRKGTVDNPWAVAWSMYGKSGAKKKKNEAVGLGGVGPLLRAGGPGSGRHPSGSGQKMKNRCAVCGKEFGDWNEYNKHFMTGNHKLSKRESFRICESAVVLEANEVAGEEGGKEGHIATVVLISEGLGNLRDKNYYGPEAIESAPSLFEGKPMLLDHPSYSEERDLPERSVKDTVGYYKNLRVERLANGRLACVGECHFDLSDEGQNAFQKCRTAVHYSKEFPSSDQEYIGISVNAQGESEPRMMVIEGQEMDVNYVKRFVDARSADLVTIPARGGKVIATVESIAGSQLRNKEVRMKTVEQLKAVQTALKEAEKEKKPDLRLKKISEARKEVEAVLKEIMESVARRKAEEGKPSFLKGKEAEDESEDEDESESSAEAEAEDESEDEDESESEGMYSKREDDNGDGDEDADANGDAGDGDSHTVIQHKVVKRTGKAAMQAESVREAHRLAVESLIQKSKLNPKYFDLKELSGMTLESAKREIARIKRIHEGAVEEVLKRFGNDVLPVHRTKESGGSDEGIIEATANRFFPKVSVGEEE